MLAAIDYLDNTKEAWLPANLVQVRQADPDERDASQSGSRNYRA
jgi:hypothetical protein